MTYCCHIYCDIVFTKNGGNHMINPYEKCPVYENENYMLRMVRKEDKEDLLKVYSDLSSCVRSSASRIPS